MALIECRNLCIGYNAKTLQENMNFSINKGDNFYIIGENGSGKSTLLKTLLGFQKPLNGKIIFSNDWNTKGIGFIPQTSEIQKTFPATVFEIVLSGFQSHLGITPFYKKEYKEKAMSIIEKLNLSEYAKKSFKELSGGQQQRVLFARAICAAQTILIMDEPAKGFDSEMTEKMYSILEEMNKNGITIVSISHDLKAADTFANHILKLGSSWELVR